MSTPKAYKRSPALANSKWYKGILTSKMAGASDKDREFDVSVIKMRRGTEPPPHVHSREDELFYILSGEMTVYVESEVFQLTAGEYMFLPRGKLMRSQLPLMRATGSALSLLAVSSKQSARWTFRH